MQFLTQPIFLATFLSLLLFFSLTSLILTLRTRSHYNRLTKDVNSKKLMSVLEGIQKTLASHERTLTQQAKTLTQHSNQAKSYLQKISLTRFNPFSDTGGDQSFILALLDGNKDGVVITSLHSRENTRFYVKSVKAGEGVNHPLSKEEKKIVK